MVKDRGIMTENERKLLNIIYQHPNTEQAFEIAIKTILDFLEQDGSFQEPPIACLQELG